MKKNKSSSIDDVSGVDAKISRRDLVVSSAKAVSFITLSNMIPGMATAFATTDEHPHFFVLVRASGGAHTPLGLDPMILDQITKREMDPISIDDGTGQAGDPGRFFAAYKDEELIRVGDLILGKAAGPLVPHVKDIAIVNGIMLLPQSPFHTVCQRYTDTGVVNGSAPLIPFQLSGAIDRNSLYGTLYNGSSDTDLKVLAPGTPIDGLSSAIQSGDTEGFLSLYVAQRKVRKKSGLSAALNGALDLSSKSKKVNSLVTQYKAFRGDQNNTYGDPIPIVAAAFNAGISRFASIEIEAYGNNGSLDTHFNHESGHPPALSARFQTFADFIATFKKIKFLLGDKEESLFEHTTFMFTSDFARTSWREGNSGTSHNPFNNSVMLAGKNILGGQKIGASTVISPNALIGEGRSRLQALPFDYGAGRAVTFEETVRNYDGLLYATNDNVIMGNKCASGGKCVDFITPTNVMQTVASAFGLEGTKYLQTAPVIPGLVKG